MQYRTRVMKYQDGTEEEVVGATVDTLTLKSLKALEGGWPVTRIFVICRMGYIFEVERSLSGHFVIVRMGHVPSEEKIPTQEMWFEKDSLAVATHVNILSDAPWLRRDVHLITSIEISHSRR